MNSNPQTKKNKIIKKTATVQPTATVEPPTATVEPQTKENNKYDIRYKDYVFFSCGLYAKHRKIDGKLENLPICCWLQQNCCSLNEPLMYHILPTFTIS